MNKAKKALLYVRLGWLMYRFGREVRKADKKDYQARRAKQRAREREEAAKLINKQLDG